MKNKERIVTCKNCGAAVSLSESLCRYCNTPIEAKRSLSDDEKEKLAAVINAMEDVLNSNSGNSWLTGLSFLILSGLAVGLYFLFTSLLSSTVQIIILSIISGAILFLFFGFIITVTDNNEYRHIYEDDVRLRIEDYLNEKNISRYQFDALADKKLPPKAILRRFLFMKQPPATRHKDH